jgi:hypothetical protein
MSDDETDHDIPGVKITPTMSPEGDGQVAVEIRDDRGVIDRVFDREEARDFVYLWQRAIIKAAEQERIEEGRNV